ncbi:hypothetical protein [Streptomyces chiangmaiensis]|uniref:Uncharacterized protein n=1 Tax=Streptomyces chiangmaiensis TaxID=766497 RepID=A0ABU7FTS4_9ACTN|nr:hypothetical protein [Streptomyces chiangmaiensis]MED7827305.1 hypothetical protein [Streptomyces chiangmaiensis]
MSPRTARSAGTGGDALTGRATGWAPASLRRCHRRFGLREEEPVVAVAEKMADRDQDTAGVRG